MLPPSVRRCLGLAMLDLGREPDLGGGGTGRFLCGSCAGLFGWSRRAIGRVFIFTRFYRCETVVGAVRFELTTSCTRNKRASQATLRPESSAATMPAQVAECNKFFGQCIP